MSMVVSTFACSDHFAPTKSPQEWQNLAGVETCPKPRSIT